MLARLATTAAIVTAMAALCLVAIDTRPDFSQESQPLQARKNSSSQEEVSTEAPKSDAGLSHKVEAERNEVTSDTSTDSLAMMGPIGENGERSSYRFANSRELASRIDRWNPDGSFERTRVVAYDFKYTQVRLEETVLPRPSEGIQEIVDSVAMVADHMIVETPDRAWLDAMNSHQGFEIRAQLSSPDTYLVSFPEAGLDTLTDAVKSYEALAAIAEPDYLIFVADEGAGKAPQFFDEKSRGGLQVDGLDIEINATPDDIQLASMWGLDKIGILNAWDVSTGSEDVVVAVLDTGIDYGHPDLADNCWVNTGEIAGNGIDDDGNGYIDDVYGYDFFNEDGDPADDHHHGTHCAGIIGAVGNNGEGIVGVAWSVKLMALKIMGTSGGGSVSDAIQALNYAIANGADVTSNSWGGGRASKSLRRVINRAGKSAGMPFVAAAGNRNRNTDKTPHYPASYRMDNIISVASTTADDQRSDFSNYGRVSVDLAAPGTEILSTVPVSEGSYRTLSGTSMAAPHVAGACALLKAVAPNSNYRHIKRWLIKSVDRTEGLRGSTVSGGRLNVGKALKAVPKLRMESFATSSSIFLNWTRPTSVGEASNTVYITRRTDTYPTMYSYGEQVYTGTGENGETSYEDKWLTPESTYYYRIWVDDGSGNVVDPTNGSVNRVSATPDAGGLRLYWRDSRGVAATWALGADGSRKGAQIIRPNAVPGNWELLGSGDLNNDGIEDLFWQKGDGDLICWILGDDGKMDRSRVIARRISSDWSLKAIGDIDGNGTADLVWCNVDGQTSSWRLSDNGKVLSRKKTNPRPVNRRWKLVASGDLDDDGSMDLVWRRPDRRVQVWFLKPNGTLRKAKFADGSRPARQWQIRGAEDVDGDGCDDLIWHHVRSGKVRIWFMSAEGKARGSGVVRKQGQERGVTLSSIGDIDGDGTADLVWLHESGRVQYWKLDSNGLFVEEGDVIDGTVPGGWTIEASSN